jgi:phage gp29-like protein
MKLWLNETESIELGDRKSLSAEIAARSRSLDWMGIYALLPDPDPVLQKTGQDVAVYRQLLSDAHVWSCYQSRKSGTLSREWKINEAKEGSVRQNKNGYKITENFMNSLDVYQVITDMLEAPFFGMAPLEVIWKSAENSWLPERIEGKPQEWFRFDPKNRLRFLSRDNMTDGEEIPEYKFLLPRHHATYQNPYGERLLARCFWPVVFKKGGFKFWAIFTEKYGMPWLVGRVPRGTNETERGALLSRLTSMVQDAVAVINNDESVNITEAAGKSASADIYEKLISVSNREISKAILGQTLTTELDKGGSFAATKEHMEVRADLVGQDRQMISQAFNILFSWVIEFNAQGSAIPEFAFFEEENIQKELAERDETLTKQGVKFTKFYYQRTYNLQEKDFEVGTPPRAQEKPPFAQPEFAENDNDIHASADAIAAKAIADASMDDLIEPAKQLLERVNSLEEFRDGLTSIYGKMNETQMGNLIQRAMVLAHLAGRFDADAGR